MSEYVLDPEHWPEMPPVHRVFLEHAIPTFRADTRLAGLAAGGSFISGGLDAHSDLDLVVVSLPETSQDVLREGLDLAQRLGPLLAAFPGDHVREPRLLICLYGPPLLHVDLKFLNVGLHSKPPWPHTTARRVGTHWRPPRRCIRSSASSSLLRR